jgi:hypothetical protein
MTQGADRAEPGRDRERSQAKAIAPLKFRPAGE